MLEVLMRIYIWVVILTACSCNVCHGASTPALSRAIQGLFKNTVGLKKKMINEENARLFVMPTRQAVINSSSRHSQPAISPPQTSASQDEDKGYGKANHIDMNRTKDPTYSHFKHTDGTIILLPKADAGRLQNRGYGKIIK